MSSYAVQVTATIDIIDVYNEMTVSEQSDFRRDILMDYIDDDLIEELENRGYKISKEDE